jgi:transposase InsO family protein
MDKMLIPPRYRLRVKQRLAIVEYALEYGVKPASRRFGLERKTVRRWRDRWRAEGLAGLVPRYPTQRPTRLSPELVALIEHARRVLEYGAPRVRVWLRRVHKRRVSLAAIQRTFVRLGLPRLPRRSKRRSRPRQLTLFEKPMPGDSVQVDVKVVKIGGRKVFQYTALDDCTRFRVLRLYRRQNQWASLEFLGEVQRALPFPIRKLQSDNGPEFPLAFSLTVQEAGIRYRYIKPRHPEQNGKVERSHRIDHEEFWSRHTFADFESAVPALAAWQQHYNHERFSLALQGQTPAEKLELRLPLAQSA